MYKDKKNRLAAWRSYYRRNVALFKKRRKEKKLALKAFVDSLKRNPCTDCKQCFPLEVMDFDHRNQDEKLECIAVLVNGSCGRGTLLKEIAKCDLVCSNCHRIRTRKRRMLSVA